MTDLESIKISDYVYNLPVNRIAKHPLPNRDHSKLLIYKDGEISDTVFNKISNYLPESSLLVFNNTRVIHARLRFTKETGANIEIFCLEPVAPSSYELSLASNHETSWECLVGNLKKWKTDVLSMNVTVNNFSFVLKAEKIKQKSKSQLIKFSWDRDDISFSEIIETVGTIPIPPYLNRESEVSDNLNYQTVYAKYDGSVAAPTAGLHFTDSILNNLKKRRIEKLELTLHVGAGTFKPVTDDLIGTHEMHPEHFYMDRSQIIKLINNIVGVIAVGTTSVRTLESLYWLGLMISEGKVKSSNDFFIDQWIPYKLKPKLNALDSLNGILEFMQKNNMEKIYGITRIIIVPGYRFKIVKGIITNYHMPRSTLLLLVAAFIGKDWRKVYDYALNNDFRFLSYGDSSLLLP